MCACVVQPPPYMLGERPTPLHGGSGALSFRQVPFVRVNDRVESGIKVRKQLRKYLKTSSVTQHLVAQMHLNDACVPAMQPQEVSQSCFESFLVQMKTYNQVVGQKHLEASKALQEMARPLDHSGKSRKWARDVYNLVQKCVQDVQLAEKKMDKTKTRKERADEDLFHWKKVLEANEATYQVQPNNPEVQRAYQLAQYRFVTAFSEQEASSMEFDDAKGVLYASIERRDQVVEESTELSQSMEEDRMETMLIVMKQFVETKKAILQAEIEAISNMQQILVDMDKESVIQQYIVDAMQPELTHRHAKALYLVEWHRTWHHEQTLAVANDPQDLLALTSEEASRLKSIRGISGNDVEVVKDFVTSCFVDPEISILSGKLSSTKHRARFIDPQAMAMYRLPFVRKAFLHVLHHQRTHSLELSIDGFVQLASALRLLLDACVENDDAQTIKSVLHMAQTFHTPSPGAQKDKDKDKTYLLSAIHDHAVWTIPQFWGNALLLSVAEELSKNPQDTAWYFLGSQERMQLVLHVHNMVFGQAASFLYNLQSLGFAKSQIKQYVQNVCFAYELSEDQRISLLQSVDSLEIRVSVPKRDDHGGEVQFTSLTLPDFTYVNGATQHNNKLRSFRPRTSSGSSSAESVASSIFTSSTTTGASTANMMKDLESLKLRASAAIASSSCVSLSSASSSSARGATPQEAWQDLFGSAPVVAAGVSEGDSKQRKSSRKFGSSRSQSASAKSIDGQDSVASFATDSSFHAAEATARQSMDDTSFLLVEEKQNRRKARLGKARSAATIDTSDMNGDNHHHHQQNHQQQRPFVSMAPSPILTVSSASLTTGNGGKTTTGMDHIKTIAAQMKQRRQATGGVPVVVPSSNAKPSVEPMATTTTPSVKSLRRAASMASTSSIGFANGSGGTGHASDPHAAEKQQSPVVALSGVAAIRARFEKK